MEIPEMSREEQLWALLAAVPRARVEVDAI
jgi:hypothetical protein